MVDPLQVSSCASENTKLLAGMSKSNSNSNINSSIEDVSSGTTRFEMAKKTIQLCGVIAIAYCCFVSLVTFPTFSSWLPVQFQWNTNEKASLLPFYHHHHFRYDVEPSPPCGTVSEALFADMHDGDQKVVSIHRDILAIHSAADDESWIVTAPLDITTCTAMVDFDVPGKPSPPPVPLLVTIWAMERPLSHHSGGSSSKMTLEFTDPSETIAPSKDLPLNHWVEVA